MYESVYYICMCVCTYINYHIGKLVHCLNYLLGILKNATLILQLSNYIIGYHIMQTMSILKENFLLFSCLKNAYNY